MRPASRRLFIVSIAASVLMVTIVGLFGVLSGSTVTAQPTAGPGSYFLRIDGIPGESTDAAHQDQIELLSFEWSSDDEPGLVQPQNASGGGGGAAGRVQANAIHFTQNVSRASPLLMVAVARARRIPQATLSVRRSGDATRDYVTIKLSDVSVSSYRTTANAGGTPTDEFTLRFGKVEYSYSPQNADGSTAPPVLGSWDFMTNTGG